jgi:hypothetical protein
MQGNHAFIVSQVASAVAGHHILMYVLCLQVVVCTQGLTGSDQVGVVLQAGQVLPRLQQATAEVAFARTPVQPVPGLLAEGQVAGEGFDLLPFAAGDGDVQAVGGGWQVSLREAAEGGELLDLFGQLREGRGQAVSGAVGFGVCQGTLAQVGGEFGVGGFPGQLQGGEGAGFPQLLVLDQELVEGLEAGA